MSVRLPFLIKYMHALLTLCKKMEEMEEEEQDDVQLVAKCTRKEVAFDLSLPKIARRIRRHTQSPYQIR